VLVADSVQREELGAMGKVSRVAVGAEKDNPRVPALEATNKGIAEAMESDAATVTVIGKLVALMWGMLPNCKVQVRACRAVPEASCVGTQRADPRTFMLARNSPFLLRTVYIFA